MPGERDARSVLGDDQVAELIRRSGPRPVPAEEQKARALSAARHEWQRLVRRRRWRSTFRFVTGVALAAASVLLVMQWWGPAGPTPVARVQIAAVERAIGALTITRGDRVKAMAAAGTSVAQGDTLETAHDSRAALALGPLSIRLDRQTALEFTGADRLRLHKGGVYIDTGAGDAHHPLTIETPLGRVQHAGTQFEVRLDEVALRVRVREGLVFVEADRGRWAAAATEGFVVRDGRAIERLRIMPFDPQWSWTSDLAGPFSLEGSTLPTFLGWVCREQGWRWEYQPASLAARADRIVLHGSIDGLAPRDALGPVLMASGLTSELRGGLLVIRETAIGGSEK